MTRKLIKHKLLQVSSAPVTPARLKPSRKSTTSMSSAELQAQFDRVRAFAMSNVSTLVSQVEAIKRSLPSDLPTVLAGPIKRHR